MAIERNVTHADAVFIGEDKQLPDTIYQSDDVTPQDISSWELTWTLKRRPVSATTTALVNKTTAAPGGIVLTTPGSGLCTISLDAVDTAALTPGTYYHELRRVDSGYNTVLTYGTFLLQA